MFDSDAISPRAFRAYWQTFLVSLSTTAGDNLFTFAPYVPRLLRVLVLLSLWRLILGDGANAGGLTLESALTYTLIGSMFAQQLDVRTEIGWSVWSGDAAVRFLQPIAIPGLYLADAIGLWVFTFCTFSLPLVAIASFLGIDARPASFEAGTLFVVSLGLGIAVGLAIDFLFAAILVAPRETYWAVWQVRGAVMILLSGALLPLQVYPWGIGEVFSWLPFASMGSAPLRIYTGTGDPMQLLAIQAFWAAVLWPTAHWLWNASRERVVAMGG